MVEYAVVGEDFLHCVEIWLQSEWIDTRKGKILFHYRSMKLVPLSIVLTLIRKRFKVRDFFFSPMRYIFELKFPQVSQVLPHKFVTIQPQY